MQTIRYIMSGVAGLLLLNSCVKDELYKTPHPDKGRITITADWSHRSTDCPLPEEYVSVSYTHLRAHETGRNLVCRLLLEKKKKNTPKKKK